MDEKSVIDAFEMMWGQFPEGAMLIEKKRKIIAVNKACAKVGLEPGMVCSQIGSSESHAGCLANQAIAQQKAKFKVLSMNGKEFISFWVPVVGQENLFIHFSVGMTIDYRACEDNMKVPNSLQ